MAKTYRLTNETLGAWKKNPALVAPEGKDTILFDSTLTGFALRIRPGMAWVWIIQYRNSEGRTRRLRLGRYPALTPAQARELASAKLHEVAGGADPSDQKRLNREAMTVAAMCRAYIKAAETGGAVKRGGSPKKASTLELDKGRIDRHIIPLLGTRKAFNVTDRDVRAFMRDVRDGKTAIDEKTGPRGRAIVKGGPTAASRAVGLLGGIYAWAIKELEIRPDNPCRGVSRPPDGKKDRRLSLEDYAALGTAMDDLAAKGENTNALDMIRLIALTGLRRAEAMNLRLSQVDIKAKCLRLADTKTGASTRPIGSPAANILEDRADKIGLMFPGRGGQPLAGIAKVFGRVTKQAGLTSVTLHTLRHSFASQANDLGLTESTIAAMIGHASGSMTGRYIHNLDSVLIAAADKVARAIDDAMRSNESGKVIKFPAPNRA